MLCLKLQLASHASNERSVLRPLLHGAPLVVVGGGATMVEAVATAVTAAGTTGDCTQKLHVLHEHRGQWLPEYSSEHHASQFSTEPSSAENGAQALGGL